MFAPAPPGSTFVLVCVHRSSGRTLHTIAEGREVTSIGRVEGNDLVLNAANISKRHARITIRDAAEGAKSAKIFVSDLNTTNGTYLNGRKVSTETPVKLDDDTIFIGDYRITVTTAAAMRKHSEFVPRSDREQGLIEEIRRAPHDDALRQVYGDWLEENGYRDEAELISLEREIRQGGAMVHEQELGRLGYRLQTIAELLPLTWRALISRPRIEQCDKETLCPRSWDGLVASENNPFVRGCRTCGKHVYYAPTIETARQYVQRKQIVAVDVSNRRAPHDLKAASAAAPAPDPALGQKRSVLDLAFFATVDPPQTVGDLLKACEVTPPEQLEEMARMGSFYLPPAEQLTRAVDSDGGELPPLTSFVDRLSVHYRFDIYHGRPSEVFSEIAWKSYESFSITFSRDALQIEERLRSRFGEARAVQTGGDYSREVLVYGKWLLTKYGVESGSCSLGWEQNLPEWALPKTDANIAFEFLAELIEMLRGGKASHDEVKAFAGRPPAQSGIVVVGPLNKQDFVLSFEPKVSALELAKVLGVQNPVGKSSDVHMSMWRLGSLNGTLVRRDQSFGTWGVEVSLDGWPSGESIEGQYACKHLTEKDRARTFSISW